MNANVDTSYEPYSQDPGYIEANRGLLESVNVDGVRRVLDLACGTGLMSELLLATHPGLVSYGVDLSTESVEIGRRVLREKGLLVEDDESWEAAARDGRAAVRLTVGSADDLGLAPESFDLAIMGNAIHLMPDKDRFVEGVQQVLAPGGRFAFNSVFFVGTFPSGSERIYSEWMKQAVRVLQEKNSARAAAGQEPIPRIRGKAGRAFDKDWRSPEQWAELLERHGFEVDYSNKRSVPISQQGLELVGAYGGLAEVLMSGYPVDVASECLQEAVGRAFEALGVDEAPRYWLEMSAVKR